MQLINIHTHYHNNEAEVIAVVNQYPMSFDLTISNFTIGIHPWYIIKDRLEQELTVLEKNINHKNCIAIGECGLDKKTNIPFDLQQMVFEKQILLAKKYHKPLILHCVKSFDEIIRYKKLLQIEVPMIVHGFSKNKTVAQTLIKHGFYLSFGHHLLVKKDLENVLQNIALEKIFFETDDQKISIESIYDKAATVLGIKNTDLKEQIYTNFNTIINT